MKDSFFTKTVVLMWHHDEDGAIGVVVNRPIGHSVKEVLALADQMDLSKYAENPVGWGGPVESASGTVITKGAVTEEEGWPILPNLAVTRSQEALVRLIGEGADLFLALGYAGWGPGQLDRELGEGAWLYTDLDADLVFAEALDKRYERALASLGLTPTTVWMTPIDE
jgi:putative transcriptional regulator